jgi:hypothetical protein
MRVRRQTAIGEVDAPAIEEFAAGRDSHEHRRVTVLGDADGRGSLFDMSGCRLERSLRLSARWRGWVATPHAPP